MDTSRWPLVVTRWPASLTDEELDAFLAEVVALHRRGEPFAHIIDGRFAAAASFAPRVRARAQQTLDGIRDLGAQLVRGEAYVITSALARGAITALTWIYPPSWPREVFATFSEAEDWALAQLGPLAPAPKSRAASGIASRRPGL